MSQIFNNPRMQALNGVASLPGAKLEFFATGTTTNKDTFSDIGLVAGNENSNPVIANGVGIFAGIFAEDFSEFKATLRDKNDRLIWEQDPVSGTTTAGQFQTWITSVTYDADSYVQGSDGFFYKSITSPNQGNNPTTTPTAWSQIDLVVVWNINQTYGIGDRVKGSDNKSYTSLTAGNLANDPISGDGTNWERALTRTTKNLLLNGDGVIYQRTSGVSQNDSTYIQDRWVLLSDGNDIVIPTSQTSDLPVSARSAIRLTVNTANAKFGIVQILDSLSSKNIVSSVATLSASARADGIDNLRVAILEWTGTEDSPTLDVVSAWNSAGTDPTLVTSWAYINVPANISLTSSWSTGYDVLAQSIPSTPNNLAVFIWIDDAAAAVSDVLDITNIQLEKGKNRSAFEYKVSTEEKSEVGFPSTSATFGFIDNTNRMPVAWVIFDGVGSISVTRSFNVDAVIDNATGDYTVNFELPLPTTSYAVSGFAASPNPLNALVMKHDSALHTRTVDEYQLQTVIASTDSSADSDEVTVIFYDLN